MPTGFLTREFSLYLRAHRHPLNRWCHFIGIPVIIASALGALIARSLPLFVCGQGLGWLFQLVGHRIEGNRPAFLERPISLLIGPLMVLVELLGWIHIKPAFAERARASLEAEP